jgi:phosphoribosylformylglycinamidine synthase subunit PurL
MDFKDDGDVIVLVGETENELGGSEYLKVEHDIVSGRPPALDLELEMAVQGVVRAGIRAGVIKSAHDCSEGGIAVALAESCIAGDVGADVHLHDELHPVASLFAESQSRIVVTVAESDAEAFVQSCIDGGVPYGVIGSVGGERLSICGRLEVSLDDMREAFLPTLERLVHAEETLQSEELTDG